MQDYFYMRDLHIQAHPNDTGVTSSLHQRWRRDNTSSVPTAVTIAVQMILSEGVPLL